MFREYGWLFGEGKGGGANGSGGSSPSPAPSAGPAAEPEPQRTDLADGIDAVFAEYGELFSAKPADA